VLGGGGGGGSGSGGGGWTSGEGFCRRCGLERERRGGCGEAAVAREEVVTVKM